MSTLLIFNNSMISLVLRPQLTTSDRVVNTSVCAAFRAAGTASEDYLYQADICVTQKLI